MMKCSFKGASVSEVFQIQKLNQTNDSYTAILMSMKLGFLKIIENVFSAGTQLYIKQTLY